MSQSWPGPREWLAAATAALLLLSEACTSEGTVGVSANRDAGMPPPGSTICAKDDDCTDPEEPYCALAEGVCHECTRAEHCATGVETCAPWSECEELCEQDGDCEGEEHCDPGLRICLTCLLDADCDEAQHCDEGECEDDG